MTILPHHAGQESVDAVDARTRNLQVHRAIPWASVRSSTVIRRNRLLSIFRGAQGPATRLILAASSSPREDLLAERKKASFDVEAMSHLLNGGKVRADCDVVGATALLRPESHERQAEIPVARRRSSSAAVTSPCSSSSSPGRPSSLATSCLARRRTCRRWRVGSACCASCASTNSAWKMASQQVDEVMWAIPSCLSKPLGSSERSRWGWIRLCAVQI